MAQSNHTPTPCPVFEEIKAASDMTVSERMQAMGELNWYRTEYAKQRDQLEKYEQIIEDERNAHADLAAQFQAYSIALDRAKQVFIRNKRDSRVLMFFEEFYLEELTKANKKAVA